MKTALIPNDDNTRELMKVSAVLSVALDEYEEHCRKSVNERVNALVDDAILKLQNPTSPPNTTKLIRDLVAEAMTEVVIHVKIHERALGLTAEQAPAENALKAIEDFNKYTKQYWDAV